MPLLHSYLNPHTHHMVQSQYEGTQVEEELLDSISRGLTPLSTRRTFFLRTDRDKRRTETCPGHNFGVWMVNSSLSCGENQKAPDTPGCGPGVQAEAAGANRLTRARHKLEMIPVSTTKCSSDRLSKTPVNRTELDTLPKMMEWSFKQIAEVEHMVLVPFETWAKLTPSHVLHSQIIQMNWWTLSVTDYDFYTSFF